MFLLVHPVLFWNHPASVLQLLTSVSRRTQVLSPAIRADENIQHMINILAALIEVVDKILSSYLGIKFKQGFSGEFTGNESSFFEFWYDNFK